MSNIRSERRTRAARRSQRADHCIRGSEPFNTAVVRKKREHRTELLTEQKCNAGSPACGVCQKAVIKAAALAEAFAAGGKGDTGNQQQTGFEKFEFGKYGAGLKDAKRAGAQICGEVPNGVEVETAGFRGADAGQREAFAGGKRSSEERAGAEFGSVRGVGEKRVGACEKRVAEQALDGERGLGVSLAIGQRRAGSAALAAERVALGGRAHRLQPSRRRSTAVLRSPGSGASNVRGSPVRGWTMVRRNA
jgi:hypothetical protein